VLGKSRNIDEVMSELKQHARRTGKTIHPSFEVELSNYAGHEYVRELPPKAQKVVLKNLGLATIQEALGKEPNVIAAGDIRATILKLCDDPFSDCSKAAETILRQADLTASADKLAGARLKTAKEK